MASGALELALRRERVVTGAALAALTALAWIGLVRLAGVMASMGPAEMAAMPGMPGMGVHGAASMASMSGPGSMEAMTMSGAMAPGSGWGGADVMLLFAMWAVMMVAMMLPSAAPMLLLFTTVNRRHGALAERRAVPTAVFLGGYLVVWLGFSAVATSAQAGLHAAALVTGVMDRLTGPIAGAALVAAGIYQWTPLKAACLAACRSPLAFVMSHWRDGVRGAFVMGLRHGAYCLGCCWLLMALLFVAGVMNLAWVAVIALFVLVEKVFPGGDWIGRAAGAALAVAGVAIVVHGYVGS